MSLLSKARLALDLLTAEGPASLARRALDRLDEKRSRDAFAPALDWPREPAIRTLYLLATPPAPRLGGVQTQIVARRDRERAAGRPFALLYPSNGRYRLEVERGGARAAIDLGAAEIGPADEPPELAPAPFVRAARDAFARCGAKHLRVEGAAGLPLAGLLELSAALPLHLALHDFALFCPRSHLTEEPSGAFCHFSRDAVRCAACLRRSWPVAEEFAPRRRAIAARLLSGVARAIFPSAFLERAHRELFASLDPAQTRIEPPRTLARRAGRHRPESPPRRIAFVGTAKGFKGGELFAELVAALSPHHPEIEWHAFGGGDRDLLRRWRAAGVIVHGYHRAGTLPARLAHHRIDLALLLSIVPESYGLTLDECALAHVPFLTFDLGAQAERVEALGGRVVPLSEGVAGLAARIAAAVAG